MNNNNNKGAKSISNQQKRKQKCSWNSDSFAKRPRRMTLSNLEFSETTFDFKKFCTVDCNKLDITELNLNPKAIYKEQKDDAHILNNMSNENVDDSHKQIKLLKEESSEQFIITKSLKITVQPKITSFFKTKNSNILNNSFISGTTIEEYSDKVDKDICVANKILNKKRMCPFYKKIPDTSFCVDAFSYGSIPGIKYYFLSHFHSDHYVGLKKSFPHPIYCSKVTANLVSLKIKVHADLLHQININEPIILDGVEVTALDANHCPGSLMFLFTLPDGRRFLHTGDFRANSEMEEYPSLLRGPIDEIYLDTTYCDPFYNFPSQSDVLHYVKSLVLDKLSNNLSLLIVCGSYTIGKEKVFKTIAAALDCKIWASTCKKNVLHCLEDDFINYNLVSSPYDAKIHVLPMAQINSKCLQQHLEKFKGKFNEILALKPTGWEFNSQLKNKNSLNIRPKSYGSVSIYGIPYSEHSSFEELKNFIRVFKPKRVIPTVNCGNKAEREEMKLLFNEWINL